MWAFTQDHIGDVIWTEILPRLKALESKTWNEILVRDKKQNHSLDLNELNKVAQDRLASRYIEAESLISLNGFFWCARWAHVLTGESPQSARQWEGYS